MTYNSLSEIFDSLDKIRARLRARLEALTSEQENWRSAPGAWSAAEITEHLAIIEERLSKLFSVILAKAEAGGLQRTADQPFQPVSVASLVERSEREKYIAPETARPSGTASLRDSLNRLERSRQSIIDQRPRLEALDLTNVTYPHPAFGPLSAYQWLIFIGLHEGRHLRQIESLLASAQDGVAASSD